MANVCGWEWLREAMYLESGVIARAATPPSGWASKMVWTGTLIEKNNVIIPSYFGWYFSIYPVFVSQIIIIHWVPLSAVASHLLSRLIAVQEMLLT